MLSATPLDTAVLQQELFHALHSYLEADTRWAARKASGLTDDELCAAIGFEFGIEGGSFGPGRTGHMHAGGRSPRFWLGGKLNSTPPTLEGGALVRAVRALLSIPYPRSTPEGAQISLF